MTDALQLRVVADGAVLLEQEIWPADLGVRVQAMAEQSGVIANDAIERGCAVELQILDPDGDVAPDEWTPLLWFDPAEGWVYAPAWEWWA